MPKLATRPPALEPGQPAGDAPGTLPAGFAALESDAAAVDGAGLPAPADAAPPAPAQDTAAELLDALKLARDLAAPMVAWWPDYRQVWGDQQLQAIATSGAAVMQAQGWTVGQLMGQWAPYLLLAAATLPPAAATVDAFRHRRELVAAAQRAAVQGPAPAAPAPAGNVGA